MKLIDIQHFYRDKLSKLPQNLIHSRNKIQKSINMIKEVKKRKEEAMPKSISDSALPLVALSSTRLMRRKNRKVMTKMSRQTKETSAMDIRTKTKHSEVQPRKERARTKERRILKLWEAISQKRRERRKMKLTISKAEKTSYSRHSNHRIQHLKCSVH